MVDLARRMWAAAGPTPEVDEQLRSAVRGWYAADGLEKPHEPVYDRLGAIAVPAALLVGDLDHPPLVASNRAAAARIPGCELVEVPGIDHLPPLRIPDRVIQLITDTLARQQAWISATASYLAPRRSAP